MEEQNLKLTLSKLKKDTRADFRLSSDDKKYLREVCLKISLEDGEIRTFSDFCYKAVMEKANEIMPRKEAA